MTRWAWRRSGPSSSWSTRWVPFVHGDVSRCLIACGSGLTPATRWFAQVCEEVEASYGFQPSRCIQPSVPFLLPLKALPCRLSRQTLFAWPDSVKNQRENVLMLAANIYRSASPSFSPSFSPTHLHSHARWFIRAATSRRRRKGRLGVKARTQAGNFEQSRLCTATL